MLNHTFLILKIYRLRKLCFYDLVLIGNYFNWLHLLKWRKFANPTIIRVYKVVDKLSKSNDDSGRVDIPSCFQIIF